MAYYEGHVGDRPSSRAGEPDQLRRLSAAVRACTDGDPADETGQGGGGGLGAYLGATAALNAAESCGYDAYHSATNTHRGAAGGRSRPLSPSQMRREEHRIDGGRRDMAVSVEGGTADEVRRGLGALRRALSGDEEEEGSAELGRRGGRGIEGAPVRVSSLRGKRSLLAPAADRASTPTSLAGEYTLEEAMELEIYYVKQRRGYFSLAFSAVQGAVLLIMMLQCGVAPLTVNPMVGPYPDALNVSFCFMFSNFCFCYLANPEPSLDSAHSAASSMSTPTLSHSHPPLSHLSLPPPLIPSHPPNPSTGEPRMPSSSSTRASRGGS